MALLGVLLMVLLSCLYRYFRSQAGAGDAVDLAHLNSDGSRVGDSQTSDAGVGAIASHR
ncbi:hypothetical protein ACJJIL_08245 [Microbulbifer sp. EKSA005]|uniref:hypothetical protein n=1 Tax=Microbulbifer sp. EKSA005 TaxID=3243364 RepID=UPI0040425F43